MLSIRLPSSKSITCDSLHCGPTTPPIFQVLPASSLTMTCACWALLPATWLSQGTTSRPLLSWMPTPGPVAYQVQFGFVTSLVISAGVLQVAPSSSLFVTHTVRGFLLVPLTIIVCVSLPMLCVISSQIVPVLASTTGQGLPHVLSPSSQTTCVLPQDLPPSKLRLRMRSISPASPRAVLRPSQ